MQISNEKEFWSVGIDKSGDWCLRKTPIDKWQEPNGDVLVELYKGPIKDIKVEFDGVFIRDYAKDNFELKTDELPWVFILLNDGRLYAKKPNQIVSDAFLISTRVSVMYPCRGWKSLDDSLDLGLFLGYIRNGIAYYAIYHTLPSGSKGWEVDFRVDDTDDNHSIYILRLNDYRIGIQVISNEENRMYVTPRLYIGGTVPTMMFSGAVKQTDFIMLNPSRITDPDYYEQLNPEVTLEEDTNQMWVRLHCTYPIISLESIFPIFDDPIAPVGYHFVDFRIDEHGDLIGVLDKKLNSTHSHLKFSIAQLNRIRFQVTDYCKPNFPIITLETAPFELNVDDYLTGKVYTVQVLMQAAQKRILDYTYKENLLGAVLSTDSELTMYPAGRDVGGTDDNFSGQIKTLQVGTFDFEYSSHIIG